MKQKPLKFIVSSPYYEPLFSREIDAIRDMIGEFEVVKAKPCLGGIDMKIWILPIQNHIADASKKDSQH